MKTKIIILVIATFFVFIGYGYSQYLWSPNALGSNTTNTDVLVTATNSFVTPTALFNVYDIKNATYSSTAAPTISLRLDNINNAQSNGQYATLGFTVLSQNSGNTAAGYISLVQPSYGGKNGNFAFTLRNSSGYFNELMRIQSDGHVGIGTTAPSNFLHIWNGSTRGGITLETDVSSAANYIRFIKYNKDAVIGNYYTNEDPLGNSYTPSPISPTPGLMIRDYNNPILIESPGGIGFASNEDLYGYFNYSGDALYLWGSGNATAWYTHSDKRFKENIITIDGAKDKILALNGRNYNFKTTEFKGYNFPEDKQYGFIAQEIQEVIPEAVKEDENGYLSVNYTAVIPVLVEAFKDQNKEIDKLKEEIKLLKSQINKSDSLIDNDLNSAILEQNSPNPFKDNTTINYVIPESASNAKVIIYDLQGKQIIKYDITSKGKGSVTVQSRELIAGMYMYTLIIDGKEISSKKMILTD
jgi:hypothetical protein